MILDEELRCATDYSQGQKDAAYAVLGEIVNLLEPFAEDMRIIGGWTPTLLYPGQEHIGSIDVDVLLNQEKIRKAESYENIQRLLLRSGYRKHPEKYFSYVKTITLDGVAYDVDVDFLSGKYGGDGGNVSKHVDGVKTLPASGGNFAFEFAAEPVFIEYRRPDGALDVGHVQVISIIPFIVMKTAALGRGKAKDAYDIFYCIQHFEGGVRALALKFLPYKEHALIQEMCDKLSEKFASPEHAGPSDIVSFLDITDEEEIARIKQDSYQKVDYLVHTLQ